MKSKLTLVALTVALATSLGVANADDAVNDTMADKAAPHNHMAERGGYAGPAKSESVSKTKTPSADMATKAEKTKKKVAPHNHAAEKGGYAGSTESNE